MFTQRAALLGFVGFCLYLIAIVNTLASYFYVLAWLAAGMLVSTFGLALLSLVALKCSWKVERSRATETPPGATGDTSPLVQVHLENGGTLNKTGFGVEVRLKPKNGSPLVPQRFLVESLPSGTSLESVLPLLTLGRGRYEVAEVRLLGSDVLGIFRVQRRVLPPAGAPKEEIVVGPAAVALSRGSVWLRSQPGATVGEIDSLHRLGQGDELRGTRPYVPGDDLRQVHWKSTARAGELVVKEFHHRGKSSSAIVWDGAAQTDWGDGEAREWGLRLVASLSQAFAGAGMPFVLARFDAHPLVIEPHGDFGAFMPALIDVLADAQANRTGSLLEAAATLRNGCEHYFLITASLSPEVAALVRRWRERRAGVSVALIDGAALGLASRDRRFHGRFSRRRPPEQHVEWQEGPMEPQKAAIAITPENVGRQVAALREQGARCVLVGPEPGAPASEYAGSLRRAMAELAGGRRPVLEVEHIPAAEQGRELQEA